MITMYSLVFPHIDPVLLHLGPLQVRWYGLMYVLGFCASYYLVLQQIKTTRFTALEKHFENLNLTLIICLILGGRLGYVLFYNPVYYFHHPLEIPATWSGGMSFHGACLGLLIGGALFCRRTGLDFWKGVDIYAVTVPIGLGLGRLGNFINGELFGRVSDVPWAMVFPYGGPQSRHPSQLYEMALEGILLFTVLWLLRHKPWRSESRNWPHGSLLSLFLILYGVFRIGVEQFRQPDQQIGFFLGFLTMGQILSSLMILSGCVLWMIRRNRHPRTTV